MKEYILIKGRIHNRSKKGIVSNSRIVISHDIAQFTLFACATCIARCFASHNHQTGAIRTLAMGREGRGERVESGEYSKERKRSLQTNHPTYGAASHAECESC